MLHPVQGLYINYADILIAKFLQTGTRYSINRQIFTVNITNIKVYFPEKGMSLRTNRSVVF